MKIKVLAVSAIAATTLALVGTTATASSSASELPAPTNTAPIVGTGTATGLGDPRLINVRTGRHPAYDRTVFDFAGGTQCDEAALIFLGHANMIVGPKLGEQRRHRLDQAEPDHPAAGLEVAPAGLGQREAARGPGDQPDADVLFEPHHLATHGGQRRAEAAGRGGQAAGVGDLDQHPHGVQAVHGEFSRFSEGYLPRLAGSCFE